MKRNRLYCQVLCSKEQIADSDTKYPSEALREIQRDLDLSVIRLNILQRSALGDAAGSTLRRTKNL